MPLVNGARGAEILPSERRRHAFVGKVAQYLPWRGAAKASARLYFDDWGAIAGSGELAIEQYLVPRLVLSTSYRLHYQKGVSFFTTRAFTSDGLRTADSDLQTLVAQTIGGKLGYETTLPSAKKFRIDVGYDRYFRNNDLRVDLFSCGAGLEY